MSDSVYAYWFVFSVSIMGNSLTGTKKAGNLENLVNSSIKITINGVTKEVGFYKYDGNDWTSFSIPYMLL